MKFEITKSSVQFPATETTKFYMTNSKHELLVSYSIESRKIFSITNVKTGRLLTSDKIWTPATDAMNLFMADFLRDEAEAHNDALIANADYAKAKAEQAVDAVRAPAVPAPRDAVEAMVQIINASNGIGRGYADQYTAYSVMRIEADVMHISRDVAKVLTFATPRMTARYGIMYTMFSLSGVGAYSAEYGRNEADQIARAKANGHELFFFTQQGASVTSHARPHEFFLEILPGQKIMFDGVLLEVQAADNNNLKLVEVE